MSTQARSGKRVVIVGGGAAGLGCAYSLLTEYRRLGGTTEAYSPGAQSADLQVLLLEGKEQLGGRIGSERFGEFCIETGPATLTDSAPGLGLLLEQLGLTEELVYADDSAGQRYLFRQGQLRPLPRRPSDVLLSDALSLQARLRLMMEPVIPQPGWRPFAKKRAAATAPAESPLPNQDPGQDQTVGEFCRHRLGHRVTAELIEPLLGGIFAGDIDKLSLHSALPKLSQLVRSHGSLLTGLMREHQESQARPGAGPSAQKPAGARSARICGFRRGLGQLPLSLGQAIAAAGGTVSLGAEVLALQHSTGWQLQLAEQTLTADELVLAVPPPAAARLLSATDAELASTLHSIPMVPVIAISLAWPKEQVPHPLDGFGFLLPHQEGLQLLGVQFMTSVLPLCQQVPRGQVMLRALYGGAHHPSVLALEDGMLLEQVRRDLKLTLGILAAPRFIHIQRWPQAIEQYELGHADKLRTIAARCATLGSLHTTGAAYAGVGVPDVLRHGQQLGAALAAKLWAQRTSASDSGAGAEGARK